MKKETTSLKSIQELRESGALKWPIAIGQTYYTLLTEAHAFRVEARVWDNDKADRAAYLDDNVFETEGEAVKARRKVLRLAGYHPQAINDLMGSI